MFFLLNFWFFRFVYLRIFLQSTFCKLLTAFSPNFFHLQLFDLTFQHSPLHQSLPTFSYPSFATFLHLMIQNLLTSKSRNIGWSKILILTNFFFDQKKIISSTKKLMKALSVGCSKQWDNLESHFPPLVRP